MTGQSPTATYEGFFLTEFPRLVSILTARTGDRATAEDLAQDALVQAERNWATVSVLDRPGAWVRRVALNRSSNEHRRRGRERRALVRLGARAASPGPADDLPDAELWAAVRALPDRQRDAVVLHYADDLPLVEIAEILGCSEGTVKTHLQRARAALSRHVAPASSDPSPHQRHEEQS